MEVDYIAANYYLSNVLLTLKVLWDFTISDQPFWVTSFGSHKWYKIFDNPPKKTFITFGKLCAERWHSYILRHQQIGWQMGVPHRYRTRTKRVKLSGWSFPGSFNQFVPANKGRTHFARANNAVIVSMAWLDLKIVIAQINIYVSIRLQRYCKIYCKLGGMYISRLIFFQLQGHRVYWDLFKLIIMPAFLVLHIFANHTHVHWKAKIPYV